MTIARKRMVCVSGLPRSGSTLMCQLLGHHPDAYSIIHSSPLCQILEKVRHAVSDNPFFLSQLDVDFESVNARLLNFYRGMLRSWFEETEKPVVVDKNRDWIRLIEMLHLLEPDFRMIVCIRDPKQVFGSIERQHQRTRLIDFPDHMAPHSALGRAKVLFKEDGVVGGPLRAIENMQDLEDEQLRSQMCYVSFESLAEEPKTTMDLLFRWLELEPVQIDYHNLTVKPTESDSYYRFKYPHTQFTSIKDARLHVIPERVSVYIDSQCGWFYESFYRSDPRPVRPGLE